MNGFAPLGYQRIIADLDEQLQYVEPDLRSLSGCHLFLTGGTGFVGSWLLESLLHANQRCDLGIRATVLTRDPAAFALKYPHLAQSAHLDFVCGDVRALPSTLGKFDAMIHAATPASADLNHNAPLEMLDTIIDGGRAVMDLAAQSGNIPLLFTSSGAVYGKAPAGLSSFTETYLGGPDPLSPKVAYHEGKRVGEFQCAVAHQRSGIQPKIARLFAFVGPYLPLDRHLAVGNFLADVHAGRSICMTGDGTTVRSYQYASEMATWLWAILVRGEALRAYNVGSEEAVTMRELAELAAATVSPRVSVEVRGVSVPGQLVDRYVPSTQRAREELGLLSRIPIRESLSRTLDYLRGYQGH